MQALEKELASFGKEKDKHMKAAQAKAKKAKADTEVPVPLLLRACEVAAPRVQSCCRARRAQRQ